MHFRSHVVKNMLPKIEANITKTNKSQHLQHFSKLCIDRHFQIQKTIDITQMLILFIILSTFFDRMHFAQF